MLAFFIDPFHVMDRLASIESQWRHDAVVSRTIYAGLSGARIPYIGAGEQSGYGDEGCSVSGCKK